jgi:hypothetical protein
MKYIKSYLNYIFEGSNANIDYSAEYPLSFKNVGIPPSDRQDIDSLNREKNFQDVQTEFQKQIFPVLQKISKNIDMNDAVKASDKFFKETKGEIRQIIDRNRGNIQQTVKELINKYGKTIQQNIFKPLDQLNNPQKAKNQPEKQEMSRE